jgi:RNA methyltransferase, TrmH family
VTRPPPPGAVKQVTSLANPLVKDIRALHLKKHRDRSGLFLAEGHKLVRDGLDEGWALKTLVCAADSLRDEAVGLLAARAKAAGALVLEVSHAVLEKVSRRDNPQTVLGVFRQQTAPLVRLGEGGLWVALDRVRDPGNLGTIMRTADAAGAAGVALVGPSCDPFAMETVRATMGSIFHVPLVRTAPAAFLARVQASGARLVGTHLAGTIDFRRADYAPPVILLMGNEQQGLTEELASACDQLVRIPMTGKADSLNLAVAAGLMIYEALRQRLRTE